jgi:hypothetical protein
MQSFPCPNPACRYVFDASMLPPAAMVTCPLCSTRFPYRAGHPIPAAAPPGATTVVNRPPERPAAPSQEESDFGPGAAEPVRESPIVRRRVQPKGNGASTWIIVGVFTLFLVATVFVVSNMMRNRGIHNQAGGTTPRDTRQVQEDLNLVLDLKDKSWKSSDEWRTKLGALVVYKKEDAEAYVGVYAEDFRERNPRPIEIRKLMEKRLQQAFDREKLELEDRETQMKWSGKNAQVVTFQGAPPESDALYKGECYLTSHQGIGYVYFSLAAAEEYPAHEENLREMRKTFSFGNLRDSWKEKVSNTSTFASKEANFLVQDRDGVWIDRRVDEEGNPLSRKGSQFAVNPKDLDPKADMAFIAEMEKKKTSAARLSFTPTCEAMVLVLNKGETEPLEQAKTYVLERYQGEADRNKVEGVEAPKIKMEELNKSPSESPLPTDGAPVSRWVSIDSTNPSHQKLVVLSALEVDDKVIVVFGECSMRNAVYMEPYLLKLASSLKRKE